MTISYNDLEKLFPLLPADKRIDPDAPVNESFDPDMNVTIATPHDLIAVENTLQQYGQHAKKWVVTRSFGHAFILEIEFTERAEEALRFFNRQPL